MANEPDFQLPPTEFQPQQYGEWMYTKLREYGRVCADAVAQAKDARIAELEAHLAMMAGHNAYREAKIAELESAIQGERDAAFILGQASAAVMIERDRIRAERDALQQRVTDLEAARSEAAQLSHRYRNECEALRRLLFDIYADPVLAYTDDGELQDSTAHPSIDFRHMGPEEIRDAIRRRDGKVGKHGAMRQDAARLDSGAIVIDSFDAFSGKRMRIEFFGMDLRAAIDEGISARKRISAIAARATQDASEKGTSHE